MVINFQYERLNFDHQHMSPHQLSDYIITISLMLLQFYLSFTWWQKPQIPIYPSSILLMDKMDVFYGDSYKRHLLNIEKKMIECLG